MNEYLLPDPGEGLTEAEIVEWKVAEGDVIAINDVIVDIETAKSIVELPSPYAGTVLAILVPAGETVEVGTPIIRIGDPSEAGASADAPGEAPAGADRAEPEMEIDLSNPAASGGGEGESLVGRAKAERGPQRRPRKGSASPSTEAGARSQMQLQGAFAPGGAVSEPVAPDDEPPVPSASARPREGEPQAEPRAGQKGQTGQAEQAGRALAKPPVRKLAKDLGVDLTELTGSGPSGSITRADVESAADGASGSEGGSDTSGEWGKGTMPESYVDRGGPGVSPVPGAREIREPIKGVRKMMGQAMVESAFTAPHVTEWVTVDVTETMKLVERLKARRDLRHLKIGPLLVLARACILAMRRTPVINSYWDEAAGEVVMKGYVNLGIAAATPRGLVVPNIKDADMLSLEELAAELGELVETAREGKTQPAEMSGGTFTITNVGVFGVDAGTPIINPGESAILAFGAINKRPWVDEESGEIVVRDVTTLALSFDHRHVDGEKGSRFLADVAQIIRDPAMGLLY